MFKPLTSPEKEFLKGEFRMTLYSVAGVVLIIGVLYLTVRGYVKFNPEALGNEASFYVLLLNVVAVLTTIVSAFFIVYTPIRDLTSMVKHAEVKVLKSKEAKKYYLDPRGSHTSFKAAKPRYQYFFHFTKDSYEVNEEDFNQFAEGDELELSLASKSKKLLSIEKL
jgi:hypothetical protein